MSARSARDPLPGHRAGLFSFPQQSPQRTPNSTRRSRRVNSQPGFQTARHGTYHKVWCQYAPVATRTFGCPPNPAQCGPPARPLPELVDTIRRGGLANQKAPRIQATLRKLREERGDYSLAFLGEMSALDARDWLVRIDGIGKKTASVLLLFSFGLPLMPVDRHVDRVAHRVGLVGPKASADDAHDLFLGMLEPDQMYEAHVNLIQHGRKICHSQRPECTQCPIRPRCRYVDPKAPRGILESRPPVRLGRTRGPGALGAGDLRLVSISRSWRRPSRFQDGLGSSRTRHRS